MDYKPCPSLAKCKLCKTCNKAFKLLHHIKPLYLLAIFTVVLIVYAVLLPGEFWISFWDTIKSHYIPITLLFVLSLMAVSLIWTAGQRIDSAVFFLLNKRKKHFYWLDQLMQIITELGNGIATAIISFILFFYVSNMLAYAFVLGSLVVWLIVELLKVLFGRSRPFSKLVNVRVVGDKARGKSFPSGHTSQAFFSSTLLLQHFNGSILIYFLLYLIALWVGITRIYLGMHYPRDVLAGSLLGTVLGIMWLTINDHLMELLGLF